MQSLELAVIIIIATEREQLLMGSGFTDFSVLDEVADKTLCKPTSRHFWVCLNLHAIRILNRRQAMCDRDGSSALGGLVQCILNDFLGARVERRSSLRCGYSSAGMRGDLV
jgi:hypothetical protein